MNAPRFESPARQRPTHTAWPATTRQQTTAAPAPRRAEPHSDERREEDVVGDEPGYGHGV
ncbi:MAG TPA: hypothetical protein VKE96_13420 [Vicinamibacterales bacterium]|nr:hypothetical protein [Vicinamibacterales bacterium]